MKQPHFSMTRRAGNFVFVSGQMAFDESMQIVAGGIVGQTRRCLDNVAAALAKEGLTLADVVKINVWLSDADDFAAFNSVYAEYFPNLPPVRTTVASGLCFPGAMVEMDAQAYVQPQTE